MKLKKIRKWFIRIFLIIFCLGGILLLLLLIVNFYVKQTVQDRFVTTEQAQKLNRIDCILILGAGVRNQSPSPMLEDRLTEGIKLYQEGVSCRIIMSGDHGREDYDEVNVMKQYALERGVASSDIFMDHAGFSTYESMYRAREIFKAEKVIIVTQEYHMYRALYDAKQLGLEAYGVCADQKQYAGQTYRGFREALARTKDFIYCIIKPEPTYLGEEIPVSGSGDITNDLY